MTYKTAVRIALEVDKKLFWEISLMNAVNGFLLFPSLLITQKLIDTVIWGLISKELAKALRLIVVYLLLDFFINLARRAFERFDWVFSNNLARHVSAYIQTRSLSKINALTVADAENPKVRNLFKKVFDLSGRSAWGMLMPVSYLPFVVFSLFAAGIPVFSFSPIIVLPALLLALPEVFVAARYSKKEYELSTKQSPLWRVWTAYEDFISKGRYLYENKILGHTGVLVERIRKLAKENFGEQFKLRLKFGKSRFWVSLPLEFVTTGVRFWLYAQAIVGKITLGTAQMQYQAISELASNLAGLGRQINEIYENYLYVFDYNRFVSLPEEEILKGEEIKIPFKKGIEFRNVWFRYPSSPSWVLKGVSFEIKPNENIAIVGKNGAGKTTLIKLLCKFYEPQKGEILVNGRDIKNYAAGSYRKVISALFQDFAQYPFSAKENIRFRDFSNKDEDKIKKVAEPVGIDEFIKSLPKGYENPLDIEFEGGIEPSKGQWQRLALARTLFRDGEIVILDEPTSNVDPQAEEEIFNRVIRLTRDKILILVSHRFSTVRKADKILVIDKGKIIEEGTHEELMRLDGMYKRLFVLQAKAYSGGY